MSSSESESQVLERVIRAVAAARADDGGPPANGLPGPGSRLVADLGFDSLDVAKLALELEIEFERPLLLNDWVGAATDVNELTVQSLADYLAEQFQEA